MVVTQVRGDIFQSPHRHIVFAVNSEGHNDAGFAGAVSSRFWPELANTGAKRLGEVLRKQTGGKVFHAIVCHELGGSGWRRTPKIVEQALNTLDIPEGESIGIVLMGAGLIGQMGGGGRRGDPRRNGAVQHTRHGLLALVPAVAPPARYAHRCARRPGLSFLLRTVLATTPTPQALNYETQFVIPAKAGIQSIH